MICGFFNLNTELAFVHFTIIPDSIKHAIATTKSSTELR